MRRTRHETSREAAQDVVSETFLVAWRRLDDVPDDALPWIYGVARRVLANQRRSADRGAALERRLASGARTAGSFDPGERADDAELMRLALGRLSERSREALTLVAWHGLTGARWESEKRRIDFSIRYLVYERLPLNARSRAQLDLDAHPGARCSPSTGETRRYGVVGFRNPCAPG